MKNAIKIVTLVALTMVASMTGLGVNVCGTSSNEIATLDRIMVNSGSNLLIVTVKPTSSARADFQYVVDLYERGQFRVSGSVVWNRVQANAQEAQPVNFPLYSQETDAYTMMTEKQLRKTFSIKVHE